MGRGDDDITKLIFEIEQRGAAKVEQGLINIGKAQAVALKEARKYTLEGEQSAKAFSKNFRGIRQSMSDLESGIKAANTGMSSLMSTKKMREQEKKLRDVSVQMDHLAMTMSTGDEKQQASAKKRLQSLQAAANFEMAATAKLAMQHKREVDKMISTEKKSLATLTKEAMSTGGGIFAGAMRGDVAGTAQGLLRSGSSGLKELGEQASKRSFDMQAAGDAGAGAKALGVAGKALKTPIAALVAAAAAIVGAVFLIDEKVTDLNKSVLSNVSIMDLSGRGFKNTADRITDAKAALAEFRELTMDVNLNSLGMDDAKMAATFDAFNAQGMSMRDLRKQGIGQAEALETVQIAALNLGVDATETAGLIGHLADFSGASFKEASDSLVNIVQQAQDAGVSTRKFFSVVQSVVGEMGLYNYRIAETAELYGKLTKIMDSKSAEDLTRTISTRIKDASAEDRVQTILANTGKDKNLVADMLTKEQARMAQVLQGNEAIAKAFQDMGLGAQLAAKGFTAAFNDLDEAKRDQMLSSLSRSGDKEALDKLTKFRRISETDKTDAAQVQGVLGDLGVADQTRLIIGEIEGIFGRPIEKLNSLITGRSESEMRQLTMFKNVMEGDLGQLRGGADADALGYTISKEELAGITSWTELTGFMKEGKQDDLREQQKNIANEAADLQRSMADDIKFGVIGMLKDIYNMMQGIYRSILDIPGVDSDHSARDEFAAKQLQQLKVERATRAGAVDKAKKTGDAEKILEAELAVEEIDKQLEKTSKDQGWSPVSVVNPATANPNITTVEEDPLLAAAVKSYEDSKTGLMTQEEYEKYNKATTAPAKEALEKNMTAALDAGVNLQTDQKRIANETYDALATSGIKISRETVQGLAGAIADGAIHAKAVGIAHTFGANEQVVNDYKQGRYLEDMPSGMIDAFRGIGLKSVSPTIAHDAKMVTGGIPFLNLQPGDIIVDQDSLASTLAGGKGQFVPDLLNKVTGKGGGSGGGNAIMSNTFNIYGGDAVKMREHILKVLDEWERKRSIS